jgi:hypothetical protein
MENAGHLKIPTFVFKRIIHFIAITLSKVLVCPCSGDQIIRDSNPVKSSDLINRDLQMEQRMLREISNDDLTPKKHDFQIQKELHEKIRNDEDYDDWEYGTEPIPLTEF